MSAQIRAAVADNARLPVAIESLGDDDDLFAAGMTSHASVAVMLALEDAFDVEFPDAMLTRAVFTSVSSMAQALEQLGRVPA